MDRLCYLCLVFVMLSRLLIAVLWSPAGKGLTSWILLLMSNCNFACGILGQVWYLIVLIPDLCRRSYFGLTTVQTKLNDIFSIETAWANSAKVHGIRPRMYIEDLL